MSYEALIARLEALTGPDREIDAAIYNALADDGGRIAFRVENWAKLPGSRLDRFHDGWLVGKSRDDQYADDLRRYTASLDAAVALVERVLPGSFYHIAKGRLSEQEPLFAAQLLFGADEVLGEGEHRATPAVALLIATLKALQESKHD